MMDITAGVSSGSSTSSGGPAAQTTAGTPSKKRDSRHYIVINEEHLINEVQRRPILYDKALKGYRKPTIREYAWQEVAIAMESTVEESKKRWRSLRDAFTKQYKLVSASSDEPPFSKRKKWLFYDQMDFLLPFIDYSADMTFRDEYMDEYIDAPGVVVSNGHQPPPQQQTTNGTDVTITLTSNGQHFPNGYFTATTANGTEQKCNVLIHQHSSGASPAGSVIIGGGGNVVIDHQQLMDDDDLKEEALDISSDGIGGPHSDDDESVGDAMDEHEEVIDLYEERDLISEIFTGSAAGAGLADDVNGTAAVDGSVGDTSASSVEGDSHDEQQQLLVHHHQQQSAHLIQQQPQTITLKVDQQTYQAAQNQLHQLQQQHMHQQQQQQHDTVSPITITRVNLAQLNAVQANSTLHATTAMLVSPRATAEQSPPGAVDVVVGQPGKELTVQHPDTDESIQQQTIDFAAAASNAAVLSVQPNGSGPSTSVVTPFGLDPDERFLLSCSPILKRLSHKKNALARLKMQQILYEIEFGDASTSF